MSQAAKSAEIEFKARKRRSAASANLDHPADDFVADPMRRQAGRQRSPQAPVAVAGADQQATIVISLHDANRAPRAAAARSHR